MNPDLFADSPEDPFVEPPTGEYPAIPADEATEVDVPVTDGSLFGTPPADTSALRR